MTTAALQFFFVVNHAALQSLVNKHAYTRTGESAMTTPTPPSKSRRFLALVRMFGPLILAMNPKTAPFAGDITDAVESAERAFGSGKGGIKRDNVLAVISESIDVYNDLNLLHPLPKGDTLTAVDAGITTVIDAVKVIQGVKTAVVPHTQDTESPTNPKTAALPVADDAGAHERESV